MIHPCACTFDAKISLTGEITFEICTTSDWLLRVEFKNYLISMRTQHAIT